MFLGVISFSGKDKLSANVPKATDKVVFIVYYNENGACLSGIWVRVYRKNDRRAP